MFLAMMNEKGNTDGGSRTAKKMRTEADEGTRVAKTKTDEEGTTETEAKTDVEMGGGP